VVSSHEAGGKPGMRVLVTGGAGYIGDCVVENLIEQGHFVTVVDKLMYTDAYMRPDVDFRNIDILSYEFTHFLAREKFDAIVHLAAIVGDGACAVDHDLTVKTNEGSVAHIVDYIRNFSPNTRLIFASTCSVYGDNNDLLSEDSSTRPLSLYAGTKLRAEEHIENSDIQNYVIFRLGTLFGLSTPFGRIRADLVANILSFRACQQKDITVFGGDQWRPLIHVRDVGRIFAESVDDNYTGKIVLSHRNYKIVDIANQIMSSIDCGSKLIVTEAKFEDLRNYKVDNRKALNNNIMTRLTLKDGIEEIRQAFRSGRIKDPWILPYHNAKFMKEAASVR
jgi:nucleoside-diphosphate-sugar epimerase